MPIIPYPRVKTRFQIFPFLLNFYSPKFHILHNPFYMRISFWFYSILIAGVISHGQRFLCHFREAVWACIFSQNVKVWELCPKQAVLSRVKSLYQVSLRSTLALHPLFYEKATATQRLNGGLFFLSCSLSWVLSYCWAMNRKRTPRLSFSPRYSRWIDASFYSY